jgi:hypothetical protein
MRRIGLVFAGRNMAGATHKVWYPMLAPSPEAAKTNIQDISGGRQLRIPGHSWGMPACCDVFIRLKAVLRSLCDRHLAANPFSRVSVALSETLQFHVQSSLF